MKSQQSLNTIERHTAYQGIPLMLFLFHVMSLLFLGANDSLEVMPLVAHTTPPEAVETPRCPGGAT